MARKARLICLQPATTALVPVVVKGKNFEADPGVDLPGMGLSAIGTMY
ncbi:MAG: hypothetical protein Q8O82_11015 [Pseudorhodobacter sp.]|nr:hypothetical protein [Pseudorhodobacter sp.]